MSWSSSSLIASMGGCESRRIGSAMPAARRATPSSTVATAKASAPAARQACATGTAPWP